MTATDAHVRFSVTGVTQVESFIRLTGSSYLYCHTYPGRAPILAFDDAHVKVSFTVPDPDRVTEQDLALARKLAATVTRYLAELENFAATTAGDGEMTGQAVIFRQRGGLLYGEPTRRVDDRRADSR